MTPNSDEHAAPLNAHALGALSHGDFAKRLASPATALEFAACDETERKAIVELAISRIAGRTEPLERAGLITAGAKAFGYSKPDFRKAVDGRRAAAARKASPTDMPLMVYDGGGFWRPIGDSSRWQPLERQAAQVHLVKLGFSRASDDGELSAAEAMLDRIMAEQYVVMAGPVGGVRAGLRTMCGRPILVTDSPRPIPAATGTPEEIAAQAKPFWDFVRDLLGGGTDPESERQVHTLKLWIRQARLAVAKEIRMEVPILAIVGDPGQGKSLLSVLLSDALGGRRAQAFKFFSGEDDKNADVVGSDLLVLGDEIAKAGAQERDALSGALKNWVSNPEARMRAMRQNGFAVTPKAAVYISANLTDAAALPPLTDASFAERIIYLRSYTLKNQPTDVTPEGKDARLHMLMRALSAAVVECDAWDVRGDCMHDPRWGVRAFHHPEIVAAMAAVDSSGPLAELIDKFLAGAPTDTTERNILGFVSVKWGTDGKMSEATWDGTASDLYMALERMFSNVRAWVSSPKHLAHALSRLAKAPAFQSRIKSTPGHDNKNRWFLSLTPIADIKQMPPQQPPEPPKDLFNDDEAAGF